jgi:hypothetical protein
MKSYVDITYCMIPIILVYAALAYQAIRYLTDRGVKS